MSKKNSARMQCGKCSYSDVFVQIQRSTRVEHVSCNSTRFCVDQQKGQASSKLTQSAYGARTDTSKETVLARTCHKLISRHHPAIRNNWSGHKKCVTWPHSHSRTSVPPVASRVPAGLRVAATGAPSLEPMSLKSQLRLRQILVLQERPDMRYIGFGAAFFWFFN